MDLRVLDLFAGGGGFSLGFTQAGYKIVAAVEGYPRVAETYRRNFPETHLEIRNVRYLTGKLIREIAGEIDMVIGGPPCIPYTSRNPKRKDNPVKRLYNDKMGSLVLEFFRIVGEIKPRAYVMENVYGLYEVRGEIRKIARKFGYDAHFHVWRLENYGLPSIRRRVFVSNLRLDPPEERRRTSWDALVRFNPSMPNSEFPKIPRKYEGKVESLRWDGALERFRGADGVKMNWIRINPNKPAPPITATSRFIHPYENRVLSPREHALLMDFPDEFVFEGNLKAQFLAVGDAVPPSIARHIAEVLARHL